MDVVEFKSLKTNLEIQNWVHELISSSVSTKLDVNDWLFVYEYIYPKIICDDSVDLIHMGSAVSLLKHLQSRYPKSATSFAVQEMYLRTSAIKCEGDNRENELLNPAVVFDIFIKNLTRECPGSAAEDASYALNNSTDSSLVKKLRELRGLRGLRNLLGPIEVLAEYGIPIPKTCGDWLAVRCKLP